MPLLRAISPILHSSLLKEKRKKKKEKWERGRTRKGEMRLYLRSLSLTIFFSNLEGGKKERGERGKDKGSRSWRSPQNLPYPKLLISSSEEGGRGKRKGEGREREEREKRKEERERKRDEGERLRDRAKFGLIFLYLYICSAKRKKKKEREEKWGERGSLRHHPDYGFWNSGLSITFLPFSRGTKKRKRGEEKK